MHDICTRADIETFLRRFYDRALVDDTIGFIFTDVARLDLEEHLPIIADFWESVLFGAGNYHRNPMVVHRALHDALEGGLTKQHFDRWIAIFSDTLHKNYCGGVTDDAEQKAIAIANGMQAVLIAARG